MDEIGSAVAGPVNEYGIVTFTGQCRGRRHFDGDTVELLIPIGAAAWTVAHEDLLADLSVRLA